MIVVHSVGFELMSRAYLLILGMPTLTQRSLIRLSLSLSLSLSLCAQSCVSEPHTFNYTRYNVWCLITFNVVTTLPCLTLILIFFLDN
jgi:hypothetical protein